MITTRNVENLRKYKSRFSSIEELILPFDSSSNVVIEVENMPASFK